jgi:predicted nucleic acid-binding protein
MVVFDASTLILIAKADLLDLFLTSINVPVAIPSELEKECCGFKKALDAIIVQKALDESRIKVFALRNRRLVARLQTDFNLGKGEAEAIALALDEKAQIVTNSVELVECAIAGASGSPVDTLHRVG